MKITKQGKLEHFITTVRLRTELSTVHNKINAITPAQYITFFCLYPGMEI